MLIRRLRYGIRPFEDYGLYIFLQLKRAIGSTNFVAVGRFAAAIQPTENAKSGYLRAIGSAHLNVSFLWNSEKLVFPLRWVETHRYKISRAYGSFELQRCV